MSAGGGRWLLVTIGALSLVVYGFAGIGLWAVFG